MPHPSQYPAMELPTIAMSKKTEAKKRTTIHIIIIPRVHVYICASHTCIPVKLHEEVVALSVSIRLLPFGGFLCGSGLRCRPNGPYAIFCCVVREPSRALHERLFQSNFHRGLSRPGLCQGRLLVLVEK